MESLLPIPVTQTRRTWTNVPETVYPWMESLNADLQKLEMPPLRSSRLFIFSDYVLPRTSRKYHVISLLLVDLDDCGEEWCVWTEWRAKIIPDGRRMEFKKLNDGCKARALPHLLSFAQSLEGISLTFAVQKGIEHIVTAKDSVQKWQGRLKARWERTSLETMVRVTSSVSTLICGLARNAKEVTWISDQDDIFANQDKSEDTLFVLNQHIARYLRPYGGRISVGTTALATGDDELEDLCAIPDIIGGAIAEFLTLGLDAVAAGSQFQEAKLSSKTQGIMRWVQSGAGAKLKRQLVVFHKGDPGKYILKSFSL
jgi:hypothetical protein